MTYQQKLDALSQALQQNSAPQAPYGPDALLNQVRTLPQAPAIPAMPQASAMPVPPSYAPTAAAPPSADGLAQPTRFVYVQDAQKTADSGPVNNPSPARAATAPAPVAQAPSIPNVAPRALGSQSQTAALRTPW